LGEIDMEIGGESDVEGIGWDGGGGAMRESAEVRGLGEDAFGQEKAGGEIVVVARGAHGDGDASSVDADFEGFFGGEEVGLVSGGFIVSEFKDLGPGDLAG
jgi:hypothetical protein